MSYPTGFQPFMHLHGGHPTLKPAHHPQTQEQAVQIGGEDLQIRNFNADFLAKLSRTPVKDISPAQGDLVRAHTTDSIGDVFRRLIQSRIISLPVINSSNNEYVGFIDMLDILYFITDIMQIQSGSIEDPALVHAMMANSNCLQLIDRSHVDPWVVLNEESSIQAAIDTFSHSRYHRAACSSRGGVLSSILTQSAILRWIANHDLNTIGPISMKTVTELRLGSSYVVSESTNVSKVLTRLSGLVRPVVCINSNENAINAFLRIRHSKVTGVAVVDPELGGRMIGNISASDIKEIGWGAEMFNKLYITCKEFVHHRDAARESLKKLPSVLWCRPDFSLYQALMLFRQNKVHRLYVLDEIGVPQSCITLTDILQLFASQPFARNAEFSFQH